MWEYPGWETQLKTEPAINTKFNYLPVTGITTSKSFKIIPSFEANLGNTFTNAKAGAYFCVGIFEDNENSSLWDASIAVNNSEKRKRKYELYAFTYPHIIIQGYNATVQGGMFRKDKGTFTSGINHLVYQQLLGLVYSQNRFKLQANFVLQTREATSQKRNHIWAALGGAYRFNQ